MNTVIIFNRQPYDGTDVTWNGLRLADALLQAAEQSLIPNRGVLDQLGHASRALPHRQRAKHRRIVSQKFVCEA